MNLGEVAVEVLAQDLATGVEAVTHHPVVKLFGVASAGGGHQLVTGVNGRHLAEEVLSGFLALVDVGLDEDVLGVVIRQQVVVRPCDCLRHELDCTFAGLNPQSHGFLDLLQGGAGVKAAGVVGHPEVLF